MGSTRPMWVGLDLYDGLGWVEFFLTHHDEFSQKISSTRPIYTPNPIHQKILLTKKKKKN